MTYRYAGQRPRLFLEENQQAFLRTRDKALKLCDLAGCVMMSKLFGEGNDNLIEMAFVDRLIELGELQEIPQTNARSQDRIFVLTADSKR